MSDFFFGKKEPDWGMDFLASASLTPSGLEPPELLPAYHKDMVLLSIASDSSVVQSIQAAGFTAATSAGIDEAVAKSALGLEGIASAVSPSVKKAIEDFASLAHSGEIVSITPLVLTRRETLGASLGTSPNGVVLSLAESLIVTKEAAGLGLPSFGGTALVRVQSEEGVRKLIAMGSPESGMTVSRVPTRYLQVKPGRKATALAVSPASRVVHWHLVRTETLRARAAPSYTEPKSIRLAVLDTGIDDTHPQLSGRVKNYFSNYIGLPVVSGPSDIVGHGTHVAGIIAARPDPVTGIRGMCEVELSAYKIFDDQVTYIEAYNRFKYQVNPLMYLRALLEAANNDVQVINLSIGGTAPPSPEEAALFNKLQTEKNCTIVAAMGNGRMIGSPISYPAAIPGVIAVGATDAGDRVTSFSNRGPHVSISAPGQAIWSTLPMQPGQNGFYAVPSPTGPREGKPIIRETSYGEMDGTSMASPQVAAAAAMYIAIHPGVTPIEVRSALQRSASKVAAMGTRDFHEDYGYGRLNVKQLLDMGATS